MRILKNNYKMIIGILIGAFISGISVYALSVSCKDIAYDNTISGSEKENVQDAIDDLYEKASAVKPQPTLKIVNLGSVTTGPSAKTINIKSKVPNVYSKLTANNIWSRAKLYSTGSGSGYNRAYGGGISYDPATGVVTIATDYVGDTNSTFGVTHTLYAIYLSSLEDEE